jgi:DNA-binding MarR family transcriptional regulator
MPIVSALAARNLTRQRAPWSLTEIFDARVTLEGIDVADRDGETVISAKVDGNFDRTGLPDPLFLDHYITVEGDKIVGLTCRLAGEKPGTYQNAVTLHRRVKRRDGVPAAREALDNWQLPAYTGSMSAKQHKPTTTPCLCNALRQASRAVSRLYDEELRRVGLRTTQFSLLRHLARAGQVRQGDLVGLTHLEETTLTRNLRPLAASGWISARSGDDRREKLVAITEAGTAKLAEARPAWERAQARMQALLPEKTWQGLLVILPEIARLTVGV